MNRSLPSVEDRFAGCLLGLAVADALGAHFEGESPEVLAYRYRNAEDLIQNPPAGELRYTDDTQMAIGVAEALIARGQIDEEILYRQFAANYVPQRGYGYGSRIVLQAMVDGGDHRYLARNLFSEGSFGNGAAMRVAPVGILFRRDPVRIWEQARLSAIPTHTHPLGIEGAQLVALAVGIASTLDVFDRQDFFAALSEMCQSIEFTSSLVRAACLTNARDLGQLGNGTEATDSVVTAIASFGLTPDSYVQTIGNAILVGGDTDTIAAMAGAISGAYLGRAAIPEHLLGKLEDNYQGRTYIEELAVKLYRLHEAP
ncbi:MAG: ADP-ribosylglycohydrolase family protein [Pirellulales bacterium]|nr:ADP-ribosylglycohydrolase family protein [Pirellulales bacterium]